MRSNPNLSRQNRSFEEMRGSAQRNIDNLSQQIRLLERQDRDSSRLPNAGRVQQQVRDQVRQARRSIDSSKQDIRTFERQISDLKRMR